MIRFLKIFLIFIVIYHLLVTIVEYGIIGGIYPQLPALGRDTIWLLFFLILLLCRYKDISSYIKTRKRPWILFIGILIFGIGISLYKGQNLYSIFIGIKYGLFYIFIFLSATFIGHILNKKKPNLSIFESSHFLIFLKYLLATTLIIGFIRQGLKFIRPDIFFKIGYGPIKDFKFGIKPPIYYLTGSQGTPRWQGIFSGPNNYGYFLSAFLPVIMVFFGNKIKNIKGFFIKNKKYIFNTTIIILRILAIILTLSRTAYIGGVIGLALMNIQRIKKHKKTSGIILITIITGLIGLSVLKGASTIDHIAAKFGSIKYIIQQPEGYGLGTSGPAILHSGSILPENYYLQLMIDIGTIGFILWTILILYIIRIIKTIQNSFQGNNNQKKIYFIRKAMNIGRIVLLIMGLFLHIFEDSMVNYLFFILRGILTGYLSTFIDKKLTKNS